MTFVCTSDAPVPLFPPPVQLVTFRLAHPPPPLPLPHCSSFATSVRLRPAGVSIPSRYPFRLPPPFIHTGRTNSASVFFFFFLFFLFFSRLFFFSGMKKKEEGEKNDKKINTNKNKNTMETKKNFSSPQPSKKWEGRQGRGRQGGLGWERRGFPLSTFTTPRT